MDPAETVVTWKDLAAASRHKAVRSRVWALLIPFCICLALLTVVVEPVAARLAGALLVAYFAAIPLWGPTAATWLQARHRTWPGKPTTWIPTNSGLTVESDKGASTLPWSTLTKFSSWRKGVSLTYGRAVAFVPVRAFRSAEHRQAFVDAIQRFMADDKGDPQPEPPPSGTSATERTS